MRFDETFDVVMAGFGLAGDNIAECFVTGRIAGQGAASAAPWDGRPCA